MDLQTFKACTMAAALQQVKVVLGHDAVILHTRTYELRQWMGLRRRPIVEVTAGRGINFSPRQRRAPVAAAKIPVQARNVIGANSAGLIYGPGAGKAMLAAPSAQPVMRTPQENARQLLETPIARKVLEEGLREDIASLKEMVGKLVVDSRKLNCPSVPEELLEHYTQLITSEVAEELARDIIRCLHRDLRPEYLNQDKYVREKLIDHIEKLIPTTGPIVRKQTRGPHVLALIGPTGVGKTTTLAKLAANLKLRERHRVGLITLDTYRIAAVDQLKRYADILVAPLKVVSNPDELREAMNGMADMDFVLIDTAGRSPNDVMKIGELRDLLGTIVPDEVHLVLSTTASPKCIDLAIQRFSEVRVDKIIFTKLDEAANIGVVLNVIKKVNKSLSYVTTGQQVPKDIEVGHGRMLAKMILGENQ